LLSVEEYLRAVLHHQRERQGQARGGRETILLAEDEETLRRLSERVLTKLRYRVLVAQDGAQALYLFEANRESIDLLMFDMIMPNVGGREAYLRIRAEGADVPVIFMTGYSEEMVNPAVIESLGETLIRKP
jgi:CheY-like chemotaxis protein